MELLRKQDDPDSKVPWHHFSVIYPGSDVFFFIINMPSIQQLR